MESTPTKPHKLLAKTVRLEGTVTQLLVSRNSLSALAARAYALLGATALVLGALGLQRLCAKIAHKADSIQTKPLTPANMTMIQTVWYVQLENSHKTMGLRGAAHVKRSGIGPVSASRGGGELDGAQ